MSSMLPSGWPPAEKGEVQSSGEVRYVMSCPREVQLYFGETNV